TTEEAVERYLGSAVKGLGPVLASRIIQAFGPDALEILDRHPERLREVSGIGEKKHLEIVTAWQENPSRRTRLSEFSSANFRRAEPEGPQSYP
ncbi:MAG: hypothetical protein H7Z75_01295, partial [Ferruginibacter sp.]|nr:hypothetical protein [Cytophagales bacterium]